jgi:hypothetical protein
MLLILCFFFRKVVILHSKDNKVVVKTLFSLTYEYIIEY